MQKQEVYCAAGMRGNKCIWIPCLTKEECALKTLVVEIKGLWLGQYLNPNSNVIGCVVFSQKENTVTVSTEEDDDVLMSVKVRQFVPKKVIVPFVK